LATTAPKQIGPLLVGIDVGSSNIKAVVYDLEGQTVAHASVPTVTHYPQPLWAYYDPNEIWDSVCRVIREAVTALDDPSRIVGIAVASVGEAGLPVDAKGEPVYDMIAWFDRRTIPQRDWLDRELGENYIFDVTGLSLQPIFSLCKILWIRENHPEAWERADRWLMSADFIAHRLSGEQATDYSLASRSLAFNLADRRWDQSLLESVGLTTSFFPPALQSGARIGTVRPEIARDLGLPENAIVGTGGHDHVCGALPAGVIHRGQMLDSMGTAEALFFPLEEPMTDPSIGQMGYTQGAHVVPGKYYIFGGLYTSGASVSWLRDILGDPPYDDLIAEAVAIPAGSLGATFVPHLRLSNAPNPDPKARAAFLGITSDATRGVLTRAVFEGLGYEARATIEPIIDFSSLDGVPEIFVIGGSTRNDLLLRIKSSILDTPFQVVDLDEATSLGAAMLGGLAAGAYTDVDEALRAVRPHPRLIEPVREDVPVYDRYFREVYQQIYQTLKPLNHQIHDLIVQVDEREHA
jgi:xylulokinase